MLNLKSEELDYIKSELEIELLNGLITLETYRNELKMANTAFINEFYNNNLSSEEVVYQSDYISYIIMNIDCCNNADFPW